jgi:uncharacterized membrane protein YphA (DoxX/SURF4 family)
MNLLYEVAKALSIGLFLYYGAAVLASDAMAAEFERFGLSKFRRLTGGLEVLGALGLVLGYFVPQFDIAASAGLTVLMAAGVIVRFRSGDSPVDALPALVMALINAFIFIHAIGIAVPSG